jgi:nitrate/nitrite transporter NarK
VGAGIFFFGYFIFEVPSNLALERFGARLWIARIMAMLCIAAVGMFAIAPLFWTLPTAFLSAAAGIALINSIGNLAGFPAPYAMGYLKDATGGFTAGLLVVAFFPFLSAILVLILGHNPALERGLIPQGAH